MPIDASVYEQAKVFTPPDPAKAAADVASVQDTLQTARQQQQDAADQAALRAAFQQANGDPDKAVSILMPQAPALAMKVTQTLDAHKKAAADTAKTLLENQSDLHTQADSIIGAYLDNPTQQGLMVARAKLSALKDPTDPTGADQAKTLAMIPTVNDANTPVLMRQLANANTTAQAQTTQRLAELKAVLGDNPIQGVAQTLLNATDLNDYADRFKGLKTLIPIGQSAAILSLFADPSTVTDPASFAAAQARAKALATTQGQKDTQAAGAAELAETIARDKASAANAAGELGVRRGELAIKQKESAQADALNAAMAQTAQAGASGPTVPGQKNDHVLAALPPQLQSVVKAIDDGRMQIPTFALRTPYWQNVIQAVGAYDPEFDTVNYNARAKTRADFTSGKSAQQINALNTVVGHLSTLSDAADKLGNTSLPFVNAVKNAFTSATGGSAVTNFDTAKKAVADELTRVWRQAGGSEQDIKTWQNALNASQSPTQLKDSIATIGGLLESKLSSLDAQYKQGMGTSAPSIVTPAARASLDKLEGRPVAPGAGVASDPLGIRK
jgi:hypothetical protein